MSRYSSLCALLIIFALCESIAAAPRKGKGKEKNSDGEDSDAESSGSLSRLKDLGNKILRAFYNAGIVISSSFVSTWEVVQFSAAEGERGKLQIVCEASKLVYKFYAKDILVDGEIPAGRDPTYSFMHEDMTDVTQNRAVVRFKLRKTGSKEYKIIFANETGARLFADQAPL